jgi:F-type H+-transporting ATPase subunit epsilon
MPDPFHFELVSPERLMFSGEVEAVIVPGTEGQFTVLKDHAPLMTRLKPGIIEVDETQTKKSRLFVRGGFADVAPSGLTILAELAMPVEDFDAAAVAAQIKDAEEDVVDATGDEQKRLASEKLDQLRELKEALGI